MDVSPDILDKGEAMHATAIVFCLSSTSTRESADIFSKASAKASGLCKIFAPVASAAYSLVLDKAKWSNGATIALKIKSAILINKINKAR